jgi:cell division protein FtsA
VKALDAARAAPAEASREIVLVVPRNFTVDGQTGIRNPIGMTGHRLDAETHVISGSIGMIQNLEKAIHMAGITLEELVLQGLAAGGATTTEDERELGCVVIDIGGGTTDIAVYMAGSIWHTAVLPFGGGDITHDLAFCLRTSVANAESLKMRYGNAVWTEDSEDRDLQIESHGGATNLTTVGLISQIIQARVEDMFRLIRDDLARKGLSNGLGAGVILTGGSSNLPGIREVAEDVLALPVRIGLPTSIPGLGEGFQSPSYATSIGLLKWGQEKLSESHPAESKVFSLWDALTELFRKAIRPFSSAPAR